MYCDLVREICARPAEVEIAIWFHDAIYVPAASDNEERSGEWACSAVESAGASAGAAERIRSLILLTRHDRPARSIDESLVADIDLSIFGAQPERFREYEAQVRREYSHIDECVFRRERARILQRFLERPSIYLTPFMRDPLEAQARRNLEESILRGA
jgi:predicted metal-dependent HD superfamily phosphohydrolase